LQEAILPPLDELNKFCPQNFVLYLPKDIVAGDFYSLHATDEGHTFIAAADCTGHGVPGALVSVVCSNALNRGVLEVQGDNPAALLDRVRTMVLDTFRKSSKAVKDGMDISLASLQLKNDGARLKWAGANNPLWIIRADGTFEEIKADKQSVGQNEFEKPFTANDFQLAKNDTIYLFTDGYADQFGQSAEAWAAHRLSVNRESMPTGKKFKYRQLKDLLLSIRDRSMIEQQEILLEKFHSWKGELEQVDDVCIIGIRI
jgi:serine phosphatase RsbU (regulator of sigma subunit)